MTTRRNFIKGISTYGLAFAINPTLAISKTTSKISSLENTISKLREKLPETPSRKMIIPHYEQIFSDFGPTYNQVSQIFSVPKKHLEGITGIEQGMPFENYKTGLTVESPSGCKGIPQLSFDAFVDACLWYYRATTDGKQREWLGNLNESALQYFNPIIDIANTITKSKFEEIKKEEFRKHSNKTLKEKQNLFGSALFEFKKNRAQNLLALNYDRLFDKNSEFETPIGTFSGAQMQIHVMGAFIRTLRNRIRNWEITLGTYNHGNGTTNKLVKKSVEIIPNSNISPNSKIRKIVETLQLTYDKMYSHEELVRLINSIKQGDLEYLDPNYFHKVMISQKEIELHKLKKELS